LLLLLLLLLLLMLMLMLLSPHAIIAALATDAGVGNGMSTPCHRYCFLLCPDALAVATIAAGTGTAPFTLMFLVVLSLFFVFIFLNNELRRLEQRLLLPCPSFVVDPPFIT
jgi:hypothetical protein